MTSDNPFADGKDPFVPEPVRFELPDGTDAIDLFETTLNHIEAPLPQITTSMMQEADVLVVEFDDEHSETFEVVSFDTGSLVFGSEDITHQATVLRTNSPAVEGEDEVRFLGSSTSPYGNMRSQNTLRVGSHMVTSQGVSVPTIRSFELKRPDDNGDLQPVRLNQTEFEEVESESFAHAKQNFETLRELLKEQGYVFGELPEGEFVLDRFKKVSGNLLVYAARQGAGCAIIPQDEVYAYDAEAQVLRGMRSIPDRGIMQVMELPGVSTEAFQKAFIGYNDQDQPDWRGVLGLARWSLGALSEEVPIITHTWLSPSQETPVVTILEAGERVSEILRTSQQHGKMFTENMQAHDADDLIGFFPDMAADTSYIYEKLDVNIHSDDTISFQFGDYYRESSDKQRERIQELNEATSITRADGKITLTVDGHTVEIATDVARMSDHLVLTTRRAFGITQKAVGSRLVGRLLRTRKTK